jgi:hypothetical protein
VTRRRPWASATARKNSEVISRSALIAVAVAITAVLCVAAVFFL